MNIVITGGHLTPALAFIDYVQERHVNNVISFIGREYSQEKKQQKSRERTEIQTRGLAFFTITVPRFLTKNPGVFLWQIAEYKLAILKSVWLLIEIKPEIVISFGGYLAVPVSIAAWLLRVPLITHEQTVVGGSANILISRLAAKVALSFQESQRYFPAEKTVYTGNLIRKEIVQKTTTRPSWLSENTAKRPIIFITGGNQGSAIINQITVAVLPKLLKIYTVVHSCGRATTHQSYLQDLKQQTKSLSGTLTSHYIVREWITASELSWLLNHATMTISRSGANTIYELGCTASPSILIPLPFAKKNEQFQNAQLLAKIGGAIIIEQKNLNPQTLLSAINTVNKEHKTMKKKLQTLKLPTSSPAALYQLATTVLQTN